MISRLPIVRRTRFTLRLMRFWKRLKLHTQAKRKVAFAVTAAAAFFLCLEIFLRLAGFHYEGFRPNASWWTRWDNKLYQADPVLFWKLKPSIDQKPDAPGYMRTNSMGFRDVEFPAAKPAGAYRIFTLGDSCTFGDGVANDESYAKVTERLLRERFPGRPIEVINAGCPGYTSYQALRLLEGKLLALEPDAITVYVGINDGFQVRSGTSDVERGRKSARVWATRRMLSHSRFYQMFEYLVLRFIARQGPSPEEFGNELIKPYRGEIPVRVEREDFLRNMTSMKNLCKDRGMTMVMLTSPSRGDAESQNGSNFFIRDVSKYELIPYIDLFDAMKPAQQAGTELYDEDGGHPNKAGHQLIGRILADWFTVHVFAAGAKVSE
jgi:lysophospholipase L1-like esterase